MITVSLDDEAEKYLIQIFSQEKITSQELFKKLLRDHLNHLKTPQTILDKMGGYPSDLLEAEQDLSDRDVRQQKISQYLQNKHKTIL